MQSCNTKLWFQWRRILAKPGKGLKAWGIKSLIIWMRPSQTHVLVISVMCFPPPMFLHSRIQIRFRQECFSMEYLFMWRTICEVHHSMLMDAGLREVLFLISLFSHVPHSNQANSVQLNNVFCKPISCQLSKIHLLKLLLNIIMSFPAHIALDSFNGCFQRSIRDYVLFQRSYY